MQILLGILDSIRRGISFVAGTITSLTYFGAVYAPLANGSFFAFGQSSGGSSTSTYSYSTDGVTWSTGTLPASTSWYAAASNGSRVVAFRTNATTAYYSDNGTTWTITNALHGSNLIGPRNAIWDGTQFVITEGVNGTGTVRYSTDGITWSGTNVGLGSANSRYVAFDGTSRYIALTTSTSTSSYGSTNTFPTGWNNYSLPITTSWGTPIYGGGLWLIPRPGTSNYYTSDTGTGSWTSRTLPSNISDSTSERDAKFLFDSGKFYYYYADNVYSSGNGIDWVTETTITGDTLDQVTGWAVGPNKVIGVGQASASSGSGVYLNGSK